MAEIGWLVANPLAGSGGQATIFARARALERAGHHCTFHLSRRVGERKEAALADLADWYGVAADRVHFGTHATGQADLVMLTDWGGLAAAPLIRWRRLGQLVQDMEDGFRPAGDETLRMEAGPCIGATTIALGRWLRAGFADRYGRIAHAVDFGADRAIYHPGPPAPRQDAVACIIQPGKARRCPATALAALAIVREQRPQTAIHLFGDDAPLAPPFADRALGRLAPGDLAALYRRARVGLCLSATNPSRIPFEMMACGLPVVELYRANTLFDLPEAGALLAFQTPESIADAVLYLLDHPAAAERLGAAGAAWMAERPAEEEDRAFVDAVAAILEGRPPAPLAAPPLYARRPVVHPSQRTGPTAVFLARQRAEAQRLAETGTAEERP